MLLAGTEVSAAGLVLLCIWMLAEIQAGVESGAGDPEAASGFAVGFLFVWVVASVGMTALVAAHAVGWTLLSIHDGEDREPVRAAALRIGVELLVAVALFAVLAADGVPVGIYGVLRDATAVVAILVIVHVSVNVGLFLRRLSGGG